MACQPSSTFLLVASSTSNAGTICPAGSASILMLPCVSLSTRSAKMRKWSCSVLLAGQVDCILIAFAAGACACTPNAATAARTAATRVRLGMRSSGWFRELSYDALSRSVNGRDHQVHGPPPRRARAVPCLCRVPRDGAERKERALRRRLYARRAERHPCPRLGGQAQRDARPAGRGG